LIKAFAIAALIASVVVLWWALSNLPRLLGKPTCGKSTYFPPESLRLNPAEAHWLVWTEFVYPDSDASLYRCAFAQSAWGVYVIQSLHGELQLRFNGTLIDVGFAHSGMIRLRERAQAHANVLRISGLQMGTAVRERTALPGHGVNHNPNPPPPGPPPVSQTRPKEPNRNGPAPIDREPAPPPAPPTAPRGQRAGGVA
jgi:hypothetical protein